MVVESKGYWRWPPLYFPGPTTSKRYTTLRDATGYTDVDDFIMNTLGAFVGATIARWCGPKFHRVWVGLTFIAVAVFIGLVLAGDSLGDPSKVKEL